MADEEQRGTVSSEPGHRRDLASLAAWLRRRRQPAGTTASGPGGPEPPPRAEAPPEQVTPEHAPAEHAPRTDAPPEHAPPEQAAATPLAHEPSVVRVVTIRLPFQHWDWTPDAERRPLVRDGGARLVVAAATVVYIWLFSYWTMRNLDGFGMPAFDFAIFDQGVWLLSRFEEPFVTVRGLHLFGDHTSFILLPFVPVYWILPTGKVLLVAQAAALGLGAVPTFLLAREKLRNELLAAVLAVAYLLHPAVGHINLEQFHPDVFEVPLALFALWFMVRERWVGYFVCVVALLLVKEDVALLVFPLGVYVALRHNRRVGLVTCQLAVAAMAMALWWILPMFNGVGTPYVGRLPFGGLRGLVFTAFGHPGRLISYLLDGGRPWYLWQMLAPLAFLPVWAPRVLLIGLPPLAANLLTSQSYQYDMRFHYGTLVIPVLVASTIFAISKARSPAGRHVAVGLVAAATLVTAYLWGPTPLGRTEAIIASPSGPNIPHVEVALDLIPDDAVVSAHYSYVPHLSHREEIYMFPNPFSASYYGVSGPGGIQVGERLPQADRVEYVMVPTILDPEPKDDLDQIRKDFDVRYEAGNVTLLKRKPAPGEG